MTTPLEPFYQLRCGCNSYPWGKRGSESLAGRLCAQTPGYSGDAEPSKPFSVQQDTAYAEMWMGTYPTLPSYVASTGEPLQDVIDRYPRQLLGDKVIQRFSTGVDAQGLADPKSKSGTVRLPFLPKILSISSALPLQIHPDKAAAARLHERDPKTFGDPNHKPEIAVALSDFEAFCGFKPLASIASLINLEPLRHLQVPASATSISKKFVKEDLRALVQFLLEADAKTIKRTLDALSSLPQSTFAGDDYNRHIPDLLPRVAAQGQSPDDAGPLVALLTMNYLSLKPGQALYIPADGIHAYLAGDIVECMASSDNTIATGFCPPADRFSADEFCSLLTFDPQDAGKCMLPSKTYPRSERGHTRVYQPPLSEFNVLATELEPGAEEILGKGTPSLLVAIKGGATIKAADKSFELAEGHVYFVAKGTKMEIKAGDKGLLMYTACVE